MSSAPNEAAARRDRKRELDRVSRARRLELESPEDREERKSRARARAAKWYRDNRERALAAASRRREDNPEQLRNWKRENASRVRGHNAARRALRADALVEVVDPEVCYKMHGGRCGICEEFIDGAFHVDHIRPLSKGGKHSYINCQPAHPTCNLRKGSSWPTQT